MVNFYKAFLFFLLLFLYQGSFSQDFGQKWINTEQQYVKVQVAEKGLYKVSYELLKANNLGPDFFQAKKLQLWHRGNQQNIFIQASGDILSEGDYLLFYGIKNNGEQDAQLYNPPTELYNQFTNLFSDTCAYFLTASNAGPWKRMEVLNQDYPAPEIDFLGYEQVNNHFDDYWQGGWEGDDPLTVVFQPGEGWGSGLYNDQQTEIFDLSNYRPGPGSTLEVYLISNESKIFSPKIYLKDGNGNQTLIGELNDTSTTERYPAIKKQVVLPADLNPYIKNGKLEVLIDHQGLGIFCVGYTRINYYGNNDLANTKKKEFTVENPASYLNTLNNSRYVLINDRNNAILLKDSLIGLNRLLPLVPLKSRIFYTTVLDSVKSILPVVFKEYSTSSSQFLVITHSKLLSGSREYAGYRNSIAGGGYDTLVAEINQLTDQFSYGERSPLAIRKFLNYLKSKTPQAPQHLFIVGLGIQIDYFRDYRKDPSQSAPYYDLVIPAGVPGGDFVYSIGLDGKDGTNGYQNLPFLHPSVSTGRLSAKTNEQVLDYLNKTKEHDAVPYNAPWKRNVLHLSGGYQDNKSVEYNKQQSSLFKSYLDACATIIRYPFLGANVTNFGRFISGATKLIDVSKEVNNGVSLITFLGHSGRSVIDVSIGMVSDGKNFFNYDNRGKYPMLYLNGCVIGNTFYDPVNNEPNLIQDWVLTKNRGAILALSNSSTGFVSLLRRNIENTYITFFRDSLNFSKPVGEQARLAQKRYYDVNLSKDIYTLALQQTTTLQGDPAIKLFSTAKPDYLPLCEKASIKAFGNRKVTTVLDSIDLVIPVKNIGSFPNKGFAISVKRSYLNNTKSIQYPLQFFPAVNTLDTLHFKIKGAIPGSAGANTFDIEIDPEQTVAEENEQNNTCSYTTYLPGESLICLTPSKFSIVNKQPVSFTAQSTTISVTERDFYFEIDTTINFSSGFKQSRTTKSFNLPKWENISLLPDVKENDSIVYYWRVKYVQPQANEDTAFSVSSFIYIGKSPEGWSQSEFPQFFEDEKRAVKLDPLSGKWFFDRLSSEIKITTFGINSIKQNNNDQFMSFDGVPVVYDGICYKFGYEGIYALVVNPVDFSIRQVAFDGYNICNPFLSPLVSRFVKNVYWDSTQTYYEALDSTLRYLVKDGEIVILMTAGDAKIAKWPAGLRSTFKDLYGATKVDSIKNGSPYILISRKGGGQILEKFPITSSPDAEILNVDTSVYSLGYAGTITSTVIGPATEWGNFFRNYTKAPQDTIIFNIIGIDKNGKETVVVRDIKQDNFSLTNLIDASVYPYIKLTAYSRTVSANTPQLLKWQVIYRKAPEGTLIFDQNSKDDYADFFKQEGDTSKKLVFMFKNISSETFKPNLVVRYKIISSEKSIIHYDTLKTSLMPDSTWRYSFKVNTLGLSGNNSLEVFFNPEPGQKEEFLDNNRYTLNFNIAKDKINPVLDVAFDGVRIMNGDVISPNPTISISVNDENKYLKIKDTTGLSVELSRPCGQANCPFEKVSLTGNDVVFYPAGENNTFELKYKPKNLPDGIYTLRVQAKDVTGNISGTKPYTIQFEVINEVAVSNFLPYPNPFSTRMWFVYTLTGDLPDQIRVQIFTITGKLVRSIFMDELGPLKIGTHKTDFIWDGTDDYGDQLANGLYIYKVSVRKNGDQIKHRTNASDDMFKNGYGKLYILR